MRTITFYEAGDRVRLVKGWREWRKGDTATITATGWERGFGSLQLLTLAADENKGAEADFSVVGADYCEFIEPPCRIHTFDLNKKCFKCGQTRQPTL